MKIKRTSIRNDLRGLWRVWCARKTFGVVIVVLWLGLVETIVVFGAMYYAVMLYTSGQVNAYHEVVDQVIKSATRPITVGERWAKGRMTRPVRLVLDVKFEDWNELVQKHNEAFRARTLYDRENPSFPARIKVDGKDVKVKIRLKGAAPHFMGDKWSLRVTVTEADQTILGMKSFSLQHPNMRNYLAEWIVHEMMSREGIMALNYDFVNVTINGKNNGLYALEEHFGKELVERNGRREGVVLWMSEELHNLNQWTVRWANENRMVDAYQTKKVETDDELAKQFMAARSLLEGLRSNKMSTCMVFDCDKLARYFALLDLVGGQHAAESGNMKMYYNPVTARLEPIVFDAESEYERKYTFLRSWSNYKSNDSDGWIKQIFSDDEFMSRYIRELSRMVEPVYLDEFWADVGDEMDRKLGYIYSSYPAYEYETKDLYEIQDRVREILEAKKAFHGYLNKRTGREIEIEAGNILSVPVEVRGLRCSTGDMFLDRPIRLAPLLEGETIVNELIRITTPAKWEEECASEDLKVIYVLVGQSDRREETISLLPRLANDFNSYDTVRQRANYKSFNFIETIEDQKRIVVKKGNWIIDRDLVVPSGYIFSIGPETEVEIKNSAQIISYAPVQFEGSPEQPIKIYSMDGSGHGVVILQAKGKSSLSYVEFRGLSAPRSKYWSLTGAVTFYEAPVDIKHVIFSNNHASDDALNLVRSKALLDNVSFVDVEGDGLDSDFSTGKIVRSKVIGAGGDGFDFSGSSFEMEDVVVEKAGDKGLSVGERSNVQGANVTIRQAAIGVASKDMSDIQINGLIIDNSKVGLALYQKKPEFGSSRMSVWNLLLTNVEKQQVVEKGSILAIDAVAQKSAEENVAERFY